jgi:hypothetical protein
VQGLQASYPNDDELLQHGMALFAGLYQSLTNTTRAAKPAARKAPKSKPKPRHRR